MKKFALRNLVLLLCLTMAISFTGCASEAKKAMDESVDTANELLEKDAEPFDAETETALEKAVKNSEEAEDDDAYKKVKKDIDNAIKAYQDSVKQQKQVTEPKEKFLVERAKTVKSVTAVEAATEKTDANTLMNRCHPFYGWHRLLRAVYVMDSLHNPTQRTDIRSLNAQKGMIKFTNKCI